jgi:hypothetical protein
LSLSPEKLIRGLIRKIPLKLKIMFPVFPSGGELNSRYKRIKEFKHRIVKIESLKDMFNFFTENYG